jgi:hypothetical protein
VMAPKGTVFADAVIAILCFLSLLWADEVSVSESPSRGGRNPAQLVVLQCRNAGFA